MAAHLERQTTDPLVTLMYILGTKLDGSTLWTVVADVVKGMAGGRPFFFYYPDLGVPAIAQAKAFREFSLEHSNDVAAKSNPQPVPMVPISPAILSEPGVVPVPVPGPAPVPPARKPKERPVRNNTKLLDLVREWVDADGWPDGLVEQAKANARRDIYEMLYDMVTATLANKDNGFTAEELVAKANRTEVTKRALERKKSVGENAEAWLRNIITYGGGVAPPKRVRKNKPAATSTPPAIPVTP